MQIKCKRQKYKITFLRNVFLIAKWIVFHVCLSAINNYAFIHIEEKFESWDKCERIGTKILPEEQFRNKMEGMPSQVSWRYIVSWFYEWKQELLFSPSGQD